MKMFPCAGLVLWLLLVSGQLVAQRQSIGLGYGIGTREQFMQDVPSYNNSRSSNGMGYLQAHLALEIAGETDPVYYQPRPPHYAFSLAYQYRITKRIWLGLALAYEQESAHLIGPLGATTIDIPVGRYRREAWTAAPELRVFYMLEGYSRLYGLAGIGGTLFSERVSGSKGSRTISGKYVAFQISPICLRFGKVFAGWLEAGYGYKGILHGGLAYSF